MVKSKTLVGNYICASNNVKRLRVRASPKGEFPELMFSTGKRAKKWHRMTRRDMPLVLDRYKCAKVK